MVYQTAPRSLPDWPMQRLQRRWRLVQGSWDQIQRITSSVTWRIWSNKIYHWRRQTLHESFGLRPNNDLTCAWRRDIQGLIPASASGIPPHQRLATLRYPVSLQKNNSWRHHCQNLQTLKCLVWHIHQTPKQFYSSISALSSQLTGPGHKTSTVRCVQYFTSIRMSQQHISLLAK